MQSKRVIVGFLSLSIAVLWLGLLVAQGPRLALGLEVVFGSGEPLWVRLSILPSLVLASAGAILFVPLVAGGIGAMLGSAVCIKVLGLCSQVGLIASAGVVVVFGATMASTLGGTGSRLGYGATLELTGAANLLILHAALLWAATRYRGSFGLGTT
jgi:hypothetical protein